MIASQIDWPRCWLMTDERMGDRLWEAVDRLPIGDGAVILRHYSLQPRDRLALGEQVASICRRRGLLLGVGRNLELAQQLSAALVHRPAILPTDLPFSRPVHSLDEAKEAKAEGAALAFVSPIHETRSHPGAKPLSRDMAKRILQAAGCPAIALGGMNAQNFPRAEKDGFYGWAAIDAWIR